MGTGEAIKSAWEFKLVIGVWINLVINLVIGVMEWGSLGI